MNLDNDRWAADPVAFAREALRFEPELEQSQVLTTNCRRGLLNCSRQWGKSTITALKAVHHALYVP